MSSSFIFELEASVRTFSFKVFLREGMNSYWSPQDCNEVRGHKSTGGQ